MSNIPFYNSNHIDYINRTYPLDMSASYLMFLKHMTKDGHILDLGCGSGRDSEYFLSKGYTVTSMDGSKELIEHCRTYLKSTIVHDTFETFKSTHLFDGIWACASLLHVDRPNINAIVTKYIGMLKKGGVFFMSFKSLDQDFDYDGRHFTCFTPKTFKEFLHSFDHIQVLGIRESDGVQSDNMTWVSAVIKKI